LRPVRSRIAECPKCRARSAAKGHRFWRIWDEVFLQGVRSVHPSTRGTRFHVEHVHTDFTCMPFDG
jgi:hypothetical protein